MAKKDYYKILNLSRDASQTDVKKSYRRFARKYHPDVNPGDDIAVQRFKEVKEAYEVLSNPHLRDQYDTYGRTDLDSGDVSHGTTYGGADSVEVNNDVFETDVDSDIYEVSTGEDPYSQPGGGPEPGSDLSFELTINFENAVYGAEREINVPTFRICEACSGSGSAPGTKTAECKTCQGTGQVFERDRYSGEMSLVQCKACYGRGKIIQTPCMRCNGNGSFQTYEKILIKIPPGVDNGSRLRIHGKGTPGVRGGPPGDLYIVIKIKDHEIFERHGNEILCEAFITFPQAVFGTEIEVPTLDGTAKMKIPPETQPGTIFRLRGKGIVDMHTGARGDQHVKISIVVPKNLSERQRGLLYKYARTTGEL
ncbi:MAG: molecular chaperone DnaJ [Thermoplasmata archaeon]|nr:MAG: molecular chaperone DnaJ [Thermoplasmata archaeon]